MQRIPIRSCSRWGLPCQCCCQHRGALLPHHFTLTPKLSEGNLKSGIFSVALSVSVNCPGVTWHPALWSPDFPPYAAKSDFVTQSDCLANSRRETTLITQRLQISQPIILGQLSHWERLSIFLILIPFPSSSLTPLCTVGFDCNRVSLQQFRWPFSTACGQLTDRVNGSLSRNPRLHQMLPH